MASKFRQEGFIMMPQDVNPPSPVSQKSGLADLQKEIDASSNLGTIKEALNRLPIRADAKAVTMQIAAIAVNVGGRVLAIGRLIVDFVIKLANDYPNTAFALILSIVVTTLIAFIPWIGPFLAGIVGPLLGALTILVGGISDWRMRALLLRVRVLKEIDAELAASHLRTGLLRTKDFGASSNLLDRMEQLKKPLQSSEREVIAEGGAKRVE